MSGGLGDLHAQTCGRRLHLLTMVVVGVMTSLLKGEQCRRWKLARKERGTEKIGKRKEGEVYRMGRGRDM